MAAHREDYWGNRDADNGTLANSTAVPVPANDFAVMTATAESEAAHDGDIDMVE